MHSYQTTANCDRCYNAPMPSERDKTRRWRPRFSVRTLVIVVTLVCCYAACWGPTKTRGIEDVRQFVLHGRAVSSDANDHGDEFVLFEYEAPFEFGERFEPGRVLRSRLILDPLTAVAWQNMRGFDTSATVPLVVGFTSRRTRSYYFWFFGYVAKLPYEREI